MAWHPTHPSADMTIAQRYAIAMTITDQEEADEFLDKLVTFHMQHTTRSRISAEEIERSNLAYYAGYFDEKTRIRVEQLFNCVHPVLGAAKNGSPTPEECFKLGMRLGAEAKKTREEGRQVDIKPLHEQPEPKRKPVRKINWEE